MRGEQRDPQVSIEPPQHLRARDRIVSRRQHQPRGERIGVALGAAQHGAAVAERAAEAALHHPAAHQRGMAEDVVRHFVRDDEGALVVVAQPREQAGGEENVGAVGIGIALV